MATLVEIMYGFIGTPTGPLESLLLYTSACILSFILLSYGLRILYMLVETVKRI